MKKVLSLLFILVLTFTLVACGSSDNANSDNQSNGTNTDEKKTEPAKNTDEKKSEPVLIKYPSHRTGNNVGAKFFLAQIERFNQKYEGQYKIEIETIVQSEYINKIKLLYQQDKLPHLIEIGGDRQFTEIVMENGDLLDLKPYFDKLPEITDTFIEDSVKFNTINGQILSLPSAIQRPIGIFYNKEIFKDAGIAEFPTTWDDFFKDIDTLKQSGKVPLALMTGENAWTTILLASAYFASDPEGEKILLKKEMVTDYSADIWVETFAVVQNLLQNYTSTSALGAPYSVAANEFLSGSAAVIANGPWMVGDFTNLDKTTEDFAKKAGATIYPGGIALGSNEGYGQSIPKGTPQEVVDGLIEYFKFLYSPAEINALVVAEGGFAPNVEMPDSYLSEMDPAIMELNKALDAKMQKFVPTFFNIIPTPVTELFAKNLPLLATGSMTPEQFTQALTDEAQKFKE
jgi:raffinose/stachyose/melibiose transport system substrate-binding protein